MTIVVWNLCEIVWKYELLHQYCTDTHPFGRLHQAGPDKEEAPATHGFRVILTNNRSCVYWNCPHKEVEGVSVNLDILTAKVTSEMQAFMPVDLLRSASCNTTTWSSLVRWQSSSSMSVPTSTALHIIETLQHCT